ncbi:lysoplasmalogenase [Aquihabitans sp. G128]|uniref:lysoplasmalogenase n=1 Tax=Aquihabitans sp. G128 TaxID=2849779 RepID=UPI001C2477E4|nr:lysoplasmalogenase [Aquihabitans sp. G128]QXC63252.1 lysoplasmalogenase [Aquihabitans sp. G128]
MTTAAWALAVVAAAFALTDWWATWVDRVQVRYVAKPATLAALIGVAVTLDPSVSGTIRTWMVVGLVLSLAGDVFLMLDEKWFVAGLGSFLLGHVAYVVGLQLAPTSVPFTLLGLAVVAVCIATFGRKIVQGVAAGEQRDMVPPVIAYLVVISAMVVSAFGTKAPWAIVGAGLFYASDATLAWNRFLEQRRFGHLAVMVTYHLGQAGLVAWLVTA